MCWSMVASLAITGAGAVIASYGAYRGEPKAIWLTVAYFSAMEGLQAAGYAVVDRCEDPVNQAITVLSYAHIAFQPFFINAIALYFVPSAVARRLAMPVYALCAVWAAAMLLQLYPFEWAGSCRIGRPLCGPLPCTLSGEWHIAWQLPLNGLGNGLQGMSFVGNGFPSYVLIGMVLPFLYGSWRFALFHVLFGPMLAQLLTSNPSEWPAIWCLFSIGLLLVSVELPLRRLLRVKDWPLWPTRWQVPATAAAETGPPPLA